MSESPQEARRRAWGRERLLAGQRVCRRADYLRCYRQGRRRTGSFIILYFVANTLDTPRLGITVSRKVGNSVVRHRVKRRVREIFRRWPRRESLPALDLVIHARPAAAGAPFEELAREMRGLLGSVVRGRAGR